MRLDAAVQGRQGARGAPLGATWTHAHSPYPTGPREPFSGLPLDRAPTLGRGRLPLLSGVSAGTSFPYRVSTRPKRKAVGVPWHEKTPLDGCLGADFGGVGDLGR